MARALGVGAELPFEALQRLESELSSIACSVGVLRVLLGEGLEALACAGGAAELGFATVEAHVLERCGWSARWSQESRALARRLQELPGLREAVVSGEVSFSMGQVIAKVASAQDEEWWIAEARGRTVRATRQLVKERVSAASEESAGNQAPMATELSAEVDEARVTLAVTMDREDAWLFECARMMSRQLGETTLGGALEAVLAEGTTSLLANEPGRER